VKEKGEAGGLPMPGLLTCVIPNTAVKEGTLSREVAEWKEAGKVKYSVSELGTNGN